MVSSLQQAPSARAQWHPPMLPTLAKRLPAGAWLGERKVDGYRIAVVVDDQVRVFSRRGHDVSQKYAHLLKSPRRSCVLDGEAVAFRDGRDDFSRMQNDGATHIVVFDLLLLDGHDVRGLDLVERRRLLAGLELGPHVVLSPAAPISEMALEKACQAGWEGIIAKRMDSPYSSGRTRAWLKIKCSKGQEFVIGGYTDPQGSRTGFGALLLGYWQDGQLQYAGKVGTGFSDATLRELHPLLRARRRAAPPFAAAPRDGHWVEPELVCQVDFTEWTSDGRLRHPRFLGLRDDKPAAEVVRED